MTVSLQSASSFYVGNGLATNFNTDIFASESGTISVTLNGEITEAYNLWGVGESSGVTVVFETAPVVGAIITVRRETPITQPTVVQNQAGWLAQAVEQVADRLTLIAQENRERLLEIDRHSASRTFQSRPYFVGQVAEGYVVEDGYTVMVGNRIYLAQAGATSIPDLPGWVPFGQASLAHWGARPNGSTDNRTLLSAAITYCNGSPLYIPDFSEYYISSISAITAGEEGINLVAEGPNAVIIHGEASADGNNAGFADLFYYSGNIKRLRLIGVTLRGSRDVLRGSLGNVRFVGSPAIGSDPSLASCDELEFRGCTFENARALMFFPSGVKKLTADLNVMRNSSRGGFNAQMANKVRFTRNDVRFLGDDPMNVNINSDGLGEDIIFSDNFLFGTLGLLALNPKRVIIKNNISAWGISRFIYVGHDNTSGLTGISLDSVVEGNICENMINVTCNSSTDNLPVFGAPGLATVFNFRFADAKAGGEVTIPGTPDGTGAILAPEPFFNGQRLSTDGSDTIPPSMGLVVTRNIYRRTRISGNFSDYNNSQPFEWRLGAADFPIDLYTCCPTVIRGYGSIRDLDISNNHFSGFYVGLLWSLRPTINFDIMSSQVNYNKLTDFYRSAIAFPDEADQSNYQEVVCVGNVIDGDPWHRHTYRHLDGSWDSGHGECTAFRVSNTQGYILENNTVKNCFRVIATEPALDDPSRVMRNNTVYADVAGIGYNALNKGVGFIPVQGNGWSIIFRDSDPTSPNFRKLIGDQRAFATEMPTTGKWARGTVVWNINPANDGVIGWRRLTINSNHVAGTDWLEMTFGSGGGGGGPVAWSEITSKPTTLSGFGITDGATDTELSSGLALKANITDVLDGFAGIETDLALKANITDVLDGLALRSEIGHTHDFSELTATPTSLADYGITTAGTELLAMSSGERLHLWRAALAGVKYGLTTPAKIMLIGDSWHERKIIPQALADSLYAAHGRGADGWIGVTCKASFAFNNASVNYVGWTLHDVSASGVPPLALDGHRLDATGTSATIDVTGVRAESINLYYRQTTGTFRYRVNGGSWTSVAGTGTNAIAKVTISGLSPSAEHTLDVDLTGNTGTVTIYGLYAHGMPGVEFIKMGNGNSIAEDHALHIVEPESAFILADIAPHVTMICLGNNDAAAARPLATYKTSLQTLITGLRVPSTQMGIVVAPTPRNGRGGQPVSGYATAMLELAVENGTEWADFTRLFGAYVDMNAAGVWDDTAHLNDHGAKLYSGMLTPLFNLPQPDGAVVDWADVSNKPVITNSIQVMYPPTNEIIPTSITATAVGTKAGIANRVDIFQFTPSRTMTVNGLGINVTTAVALAAGIIVIYETDANGRPTTLLYQSPAISLATTGGKWDSTTFTFVAGVTYFLGVMHSSTATLSAWPTSAVPPIAGGSIGTAARAVLNKTPGFASIPNPWVYSSGDLGAGPAPAIWLRAT